MRYISVPLFVLSLALPGLFALPAQSAVTQAVSADQAPARLGQCAAVAAVKGQLVQGKAKKGTVVTVSLSATRQVVANHEDPFDLTVSATVQVNGKAAKGKVVFYDGSKRIGSATLKKGKAKQVAPPDSKFGKHVYKVKFTPSSSKAKRASGQAATLYERMATASGYQIGGETATTDKTTAIKPGASVKLVANYTDKDGNKLSGTATVTIRKKSAKIKDAYVAVKTKKVKVKNGKAAFTWKNTLAKGKSAQIVWVFDSKGYQWGSFTETLPIVSGSADSTPTPTPTTTAPKVPNLTCRTVLVSECVQYAYYPYMHCVQMIQKPVQQCTSL
jgi:uncharacterized cupredoxin-like copper-binding protein